MVRVKGFSSVTRPRLHIQAFDVVFLQDIQCADLEKSQSAVIGPSADSLPCLKGGMSLG